MARWTLIGLPVAPIQTKMATGCDGCNLLSSVLHHNNKPFRVSLTPKAFSWTSEDDGCYTNTIILKEVVAIVPYKQDYVHQTSNGDLEMSTLNCSFVVHAIKRMKHHKWRTKKFLFDCHTSRECQQWMHAVQQQLAAMIRPKRLLVFINPVGGKKLAGKIYREKIQPLFDLADIQAEVIVTERANHAKDYLEVEDLAKLDGVVTVGGDGMFHEIINGLIRRTQQDCGIDTSLPDFTPVQPDLTIGVIPAGSTDAVAYCTTGINDPITSALHIIIGDVHPLDVCSVKHRSEVQRYSVSMAAYGFFGDVLQDSEKLRWMGPKRYDCSGFKKFMLNRGYEGSVTFLYNEGLDTHPQDTSRCRTGCFVCKQSTQDENYVDGSCSNESSAVQKHSGSKWKSIEGRFISVIAANMSCACAKSPEGLSPSAHLADGRMDLILVKHTSRFQYLRHMLRLASRGDHFNFPFVDVYRVKEFHFKPMHHHDNAEEETAVEPMMEAHSDRQSLAVTAKQRKTKANVRSSWNVDGESVEQPGIHIRVHHQLIKIFARGIEECHDTPTCSMCYRA